MDPLTPSIINANGHLFMHGKKVGILLSHSIRASMKHEKYDVRVTFTTDGVVSCSCKAGSIGSKHLLCVHVLPVVFQFAT
jgi:hypothetical protein